MGSMRTHMGAIMLCYSEFQRHALQGTAVARQACPSGWCRVFARVRRIGWSLKRLLPTGTRTVGGCGQIALPTGRGVVLLAVMNGLSRMANGLSQGHIITASSLLLELGEHPETGMRAALGIHAGSRGRSGGDPSPIEREEAPAHTAQQRHSRRPPSAGGSQARRTTRTGMGLPLYYIGPTEKHSTNSAPHPPCDGSLSEFRPCEATAARRDWISRIHLPGPARNFSDSDGIASHLAREPIGLVGDNGKRWWW
jgi:hypothetical protein